MKEHKFEKKTWEDVRGEKPEVAYNYLDVPFVCSECGYISTRDRRTYTPRKKEPQDCDEALVMVIHES